MQEIALGGYRLAVDVEGTKEYYAAHPLPWVTCTCGGCRNFVQAVKLLPDNFPSPCFQMDVRFQLPWVLEEANPDAE